MNNKSGCLILTVLIFCVVQTNLQAGIGQNSINRNADSLNAVFEEVHGIVVGEVETVNAAVGWAKDSTVDGFTGTHYYRWNGGDSFWTPDTGTIEYKFKINNPGTYRFLWHSKITKGTATGDCNDSWMKISGCDDFFAKKGSTVKYPAQGMFVQSKTVVEGASANGWMKIYSSGTVDWTWNVFTNDNDGYNIYSSFDSPGVYTLQISGRSNNHAIDRFVLFDETKYSAQEATMLVNPQTLHNSTIAYFRLDVNSGFGNISITPAKVLFATGEQATILATANPGYTFSGWEGDTTTSSNPLSLAISKNTSIMANYIELPKYTLTLSSVNGTITKTPGKKSYYQGEKVTITAKPSAGYEFAGWRGDTVTSNNPISVEMFQDRVYEAIFYKITSSDYAEIDKIHVFPNPCSETLIINNISVGSLITIHDLLGKELRRYSVVEENINLDLSGLKHGSYLLNIKEADSGKRNKPFKLIIE
jgi:hypothetical protein